MTACRSYVSHAIGTPLEGLIVHRCPLWPDGRRGPNPPLPDPPVAGQPRRGPRNVLVADTEKYPPRFCVVEVPDDPAIDLKLWPRINEALRQQRARRRVAPLIS